MKCPNCSNWINTRVVDSRPGKTYNHTYRRYDCPECNQRFTTREIWIEEYERLLKEDIPLLEAVREMKVVIEFLLRVIFRTKPTLDANVIKEQVEFCEEGMKERIKKYSNFQLK